MTESQNNSRVSSCGQNPDTMSTLSARGDIAAELSYLDNTIVAITEIISELEQRLSPILFSNEEDDKPKEAGISGAVVDRKGSILSMQIRNLKHELENNKSRLIKISSSIQL